MHCFDLKPDLHLLSVYFTGRIGQQAKVLKGKKNFNVTEFELRLY